MSLKAKLEAIVYAADEPVTLAQLAGVFADEILETLEPATSEDRPPAPPEEPEALFPDSPDADADGAATPAEGAKANDEKKKARQRDRRVKEALQGLLAELTADYANGDRGMEIREIAGGYRMGTKPEYHDSVRGFVKSLKPPMKLSLQALETLAVVAYKQPVTAPEISEIRGVDTSGVLGSLISRKLITTAGRKPVIGRPILYKTTKEFLLRFGLKDVNDLPSMEEFEKMAGELELAEAEVYEAGTPGSSLDRPVVQEGAADPPDSEAGKDPDENSPEEAGEATGGNS